MRLREEFASLGTKRFEATGVGGLFIALERDESAVDEMDDVCLARSGTIVRGNDLGRNRFDFARLK